MESTCVTNQDLGQKLQFRPGLSGSAVCEVVCKVWGLGLVTNATDFVIMDGDLDLPAGDYSFCRGIRAGVPTRGALAWDALVQFTGVSKERLQEEGNFDDDDAIKLEDQGYTTATLLKTATREGLQQAGLNCTKVDYIKGAPLVDMRQELQATLKRAVDGIELKLELQQKRRKYSVTDAKAVGKAIITHHDAMSRVQDILGQFLRGPLPPLIDEAFKKQWKEAKEEKDLQALAVQAISAMCMCYTVLDTHKCSYYKVPTAKINISLSASHLACWPTLIAPIELKFSLADESSHSEGVGQLSDHWENVEVAQPCRQHMVGCLLGQGNIEIWKFGKRSLPKTSGKLPFVWEVSDAGYQALSAFVRASTHVLGYQPLAVPADFTTESNTDVKDLRALGGNPDLHLVCSASFGSEEKQVAVKFGDASGIAQEVAILKQLAGQRGVPDVLEHGQLPAEACPELHGLTHYFVMSPLGEHLGDDHSAADVLMAFRDVAGVLSQLSKCNLLHRDLSPGNIILGKKGDTTQGLLIDYHVSTSTGGSLNLTHPAPITGTKMYWALRFHSAGCLVSDLPCTVPHEHHARQHSEATDVEGLFYCLLDIASGGQAIAWRHADTERELYTYKFAAMFSASTWCHILSKCRSDLQPVIAKLHAAIFKGSEHLYLAEPVTTELFISHLPQPLVPPSA